MVIDVQNKEPFSSTIAIGGLGADARATGAVIERAIAEFAAANLHVVELHVTRGAITLKGFYDATQIAADQFKQAVVIIGQKLALAKRMVESWAPTTPEKDLPKSAEDS